MAKRIHTTDIDICLYLVHPVYKTTIVYKKMPEGDEYPEEKQRLIKELRVMKWFRKDGITSVEQYVTTKNEIATNRSVIFDRYSNRFYTIAHSAHDVHEHLRKSTTTNKIGFTHVNHL